jgi:hypothetical protein
MNRQHTKTLVLAGIALCVGILAFTTVAEANCPPARISLDATRGEPGATLTVTGTNFASACNDVGSRPLPPQPARKIKIFLKQGKKSVLLSTVAAADSKLRFSVSVTIPANTAPGKTTLTAEAHGATTTPVTFDVVGSAR